MLRNLGIQKYSCKIHIFLVKLNILTKVQEHKESKTTKLLEPLSISTIP